ncbi:MAG: PilZ domain-containing protein [Phycisphaerales bacterium]|nr:PilZ domain-containing protein [Phycisphaerales bacterium]
MFRSGQELFIDFGGLTTQRVLHPVVAGDPVEDATRIAFVDRDIDQAPPQPGTTVTIFFHGPNEFMQVPGEVVHLATEDEGSPLGVRAIGDPASAETRKCFRVSTVLADYQANLGRLGRRKIADVSATGIAFVTTHKLALGDAVDVSIDVGGRRFEGRGFVQSVKEVRQGHRYGVLCTNSGKTNIQKGLQLLTMEAQRSQLRRLSGAA